ACAQDIVDLAREIQAKVLERFQVALHPEPVWLGFTDTGQAIQDTQSR
ncbi:MAG: hypothetical protein AAFY60_06415, partial [Myxococcota bacterium]